MKPVQVGAVFLCKALQIKSTFILGNKIFNHIRMSGFFHTPTANIVLLESRQIRQHLNMFVLNLN